MIRLCEHHMASRMIQGMCRLAAAMIVAAALATPVDAVHAANVVISDGNSQIVIDPDSTANMHSWTVDSVEHLFAQQFFVRQGGLGGETNVNTLSKTAQSSTADSLSVQYTGGALAPQFTIDFDYTLNGGGLGSGSSHLQAVIRITSLVQPGGGNLDMHFFQYADFDLNSTANDASVQILGSPVNAVSQADGTSTLAEIVLNSAVAPISHYQADLLPTIFNSLSDGSPTTLSDAAGPAGPGDLSWALQWDFSLAPGEHFTIVKDLVITSIPEPSALGLMMLTGLLAIRRRG